MPSTFLVLADTHGDLKPLKKVLRSHMGRVDAVIHLGDGIDDLDRLRAGGMAIIPWEAVRGNADGFSSAPLIKIIDAGENKIMLVHGHLMGVQEGCGRVVDAARSAGADAVFFGHTHRAFWEEYSGIIALCPGSLSRPGDGDSGSYAIVRAGHRGDFDISVRRLEKRGGP
jgi:putative phosphoesterase